MADNQNLKHSFFDWPLTGRLITSVDPLLLKKGDFQVLQNMRYTDQGITGVSGMTRLNANNAITPSVVVGGFHFEKD